MPLLLWTGEEGDACLPGEEGDACLFYYGLERRGMHAYLEEGDACLFYNGLAQQGVPHARAPR
jgi:hypothetical protein